MLITLCYLYLWARWGRRPAALVRATVQRLRASRCSFTFCGAAVQPRGARVCLSRGGRVFCVGESEFPIWTHLLKIEPFRLRILDIQKYRDSIDDLNKWALFLVSPFILEAEHIAFVTESIWVQGETLQRPSSSSESGPRLREHVRLGTCHARADGRSTSWQKLGVVDGQSGMLLEEFARSVARGPRFYKKEMHLASQIVKWADCCLPLACRPGDPYQLIAEASVDNFSKLGVAFMEDRLQMADGLVPQKIEMDAQEIESVRK
ncbi:biotin--protein ligase isoform X5 [Prionailurus iriomotensis]